MAGREKAVTSFSKILIGVALIGVLAGCAKMEPTAIERDDGTIQYCPNPYNRHHVLMAARRYCAPLPAQPLGFESCPDDELVDGWVFACRYNPGYKALEIDDVRPEEPAPAEEPAAVEEGEAPDPDADDAEAAEPEPDAAGEEMSDEEMPATDG